MKRNIFEEIKAGKQRDNFQHGWRLISGLEEVLVKFQSLHITTPLSPLTFFEYLPITAITCFESYFKIKAQELFEMGEPYLTNSKQLINVKNSKIDLCDFGMVSSGEVKVEDLITHVLSFSKPESIDATFSTILNKDFFTSLKKFIPSKPIAHFHEKVGFFKANEQAILRDIALTYELRHIYCHEFNSLIEVEKATLLRYVCHCISFLQMAEIYFNSIIYPVHSLQVINKDGTSEAKKRFQGTQKELEDLIEKIVGELYALGCDTDIVHEELIGDMALWKKYRQKTAKWYCDNFTGRDNYNLMYWNRMDSLTREKIIALYNYYEKELEPIRKYSNMQTYK